MGFDIDAYFDSLDLMNHLTPTRGNGLRAMVGRIREIASPH
ncbi:MAG: SufE family protein [Pseudomonadales bacterium]